MGSVKKALKPITRVVDDIIPNEIKPALPYLAATFGAPYLAPAFGSLGGAGIGGLALRKGLAGALANVGTQVALGKNVNPVSAAVSGLFAGAGPALAETGKFGKSVGEFISPGKIGEMTLGGAAAAATTPLTAGTAEAAYDAAKEAEEAYEKYLAEQEAAGNADIQTRVDFITRYLQNAGFDQDYIDNRLNELGYAANGGLMGTRVGFKTGGRVGFKEGGGDFDFTQALSDMFDAIREAQETQAGVLRDEEEKEKEIKEAIRQLDLFRDEKAKGGIMATRVGFKNGGTDYSPTVPYGGRTSEFFLNAMKRAKNERDARPGYGEKERFRTVGEIIDPNSFLKYLFPFDEFPKSRKEIKRELEEVMEDSEKKDNGEMMARDDRIGLLFNLLEAERMAGDDANLDKIREYEAELADLMGSRKTAAEGGIMDLKMGDMPAEMDLRGGGFVPIGAKEKADDVPARLSKNEFVMTADAVRAAGGGSVNKGAKKMYDLMNKLEARV